jgi:hypothetical protein
MSSISAVSWQQLIPITIIAALALNEIKDTRIKDNYSKQGGRKLQSKSPKNKSKRRSIKKKKTRKSLRQKNHKKK